MGLDADGLLFLADCKVSGVDFEKMLTIGRQHLMVDAGMVRNVTERIGCFDAGLLKDLVEGKSSPFSDEIFRMLGARDLDALDYSDFEGANVVHDLNRPLDPSLEGKYDIIFDGGTLEHVFNCQEALRSYMKLCKVGGSIVITTPANNWMGHGFYQFGPDFYFRTLCPENGFRIRRMIITAVGPWKRWYEVSDPKEIKCRIELISILRQMIILVHAVKEKDGALFETVPQQQSYEQEDYGRMKEEREERSDNAFMRILSRKCPGLAGKLRALRTAFIFYTTLTTLNRKKFKPVSKWPGRESGNGSG